MTSNAPSDGPGPDRTGPRRRLIVFGCVTGLATAFALGPRVDFEERWIEPELPGDLQAYVGAADSGLVDLRVGDERGIVWADGDTRGRTPASVVYLHGFSADRHEIEPVVTDLARTLDANVYFTRLSGHGRDGAAMAEATVEDWLDDTAEAVAIGERLGEHVVLVGTSTGGTLAVWAATRPEAKDRISALVLLSPNFHPKDRSSRVLLYPWGGVLARLVVGQERCFDPLNEAQERHWTTCYPTSALSPMMALVEHVRSLDSSPIEAPTLVLYSPDDDVVDATETERLLSGREGEGVHLQMVEGSSDPARHVLAGDIVSPDSNAEVLHRIVSFLESVLPVAPPATRLGPRSSR